MDESLKEYNKGWRDAQDKYFPEIERLRRVEQAARAYVKARDLDRSIMEQLDYHNALKAALDNG